MDFIPRPEETKKFGIKWIKWNILKYPHIFLISLNVPFIIYVSTKLTINVHRGLNDGTYVPNVIMNRYAICRPDDYSAQITPKRYLN